MRARDVAAGMILLIGAMRATAQDPHFTQFYATPTYVSPAFSGTGAQTRIAMQYRDQWPSIPGAFVTYNFALDHYLSELNSGIGLLVTHDRAGTGALRYSSITAQYAYEIELKRKVFLRPALQFGYVNHAVDYSRLVFGDQLSRGGDVSTYEYNNGRSATYVDIGSGALFFTPKMWLGISMHHMNRPNQSLLMQESKVPMKFSMHGGYRFKIVAPVIKKNPESVIAAFNYRSQGKYDQLDIGAYFERGAFIGGLWFRGIPLMKAYEPGYGNSDALSFVVGAKVNDWRFGYSYDLTISKLAANSGGAHEITLVYEIANRYRKKSMAKRRIVPCAKF